MPDNMHGCILLKDGFVFENGTNCYEIKSQDKNSFKESIKDLTIFEKGVN